MIFITPQVDTVPSIRWDKLQAPCAAVPTQHYEGHLPGSGVQKHSADDAYAKHGIVMMCHESVGICGPRRLWEARQGNRSITFHPRHDTARFMALAILVGA